jgi:hypothetical protein
VGIGCVFGNTYKVRKDEYRQKRFALIGWLSILPALYFVTGSIVKYELGFTSSFTLLDWLQATPTRHQYFNFVSPIVFLGGISLCLFLNGSLFIKANLVSPSRINLYARGHKLNLLLTLTSGLLLATLLLYILAENI